MKFLKKNQILIYVLALMLVTAGYLNYTSKEHDLNSILQTSTKTEQQSETANIGDAQLVNSEINNNTENIIPTQLTAEEIQDPSKETQNTEQNETSIQTNATEENNYFSKSKLERETMYSQMLETYEKVLNGINSQETQKQAASEEIKKINDTKNSIMICENLITTKGFENNVIFVNGESISVIIGAQELTQEQISQLQNIISRELNAKIENIHIATK